MACGEYKASAGCLSLQGVGARTPETHLEDGHLRAVGITLRGLCEICVNANGLENGKVFGSERLNARGHTLSGKGQIKVIVNEEAEEHT